MIILKKVFEKILIFFKEKNWLRKLIAFEILFFVLINFANQFFKVCLFSPNILGSPGCTEQVSLLEFFGPNYKYYLLNLFLIMGWMVAITYVFGNISKLKILRKSLFLKIVLAEISFILLYFPIKMTYFVIVYITNYCENGLCNSFYIWDWFYDMFYGEIYYFFFYDDYIFLIIPFIIYFVYKLVRFVCTFDKSKRMKLIQVFNKVYKKFDFFKTVASIELVLIFIAIILSHIKGICVNDYCTIRETIFSYLGAGYFLYVVEVAVIVVLSLYLTKLLVNFTKKVLVGRLYFAILKVQIWLLYIFVFICNTTAILVYEGTSSGVIISFYDLLISYYYIWSNLLVYYILIPNLAFLIFVFCKYLIKKGFTYNKDSIISKLLKKYGRLRNIIFIELVAFVAVFIKMHTNELCVRTTVDSSNSCLEHASFFANFNWEYLYLVLGLIFIIGYVIGLTALAYKFFQFAFKQKKLVYKILSVDFLLFCLGVFVIALFFIYSFSGNQCSDDSCNVYSFWTEIVYLNFAIFGVLLLPPIVKALFVPPLIIGLYLDYVKERFKDNLIEITIIVASIFAFYLFRFDVKIFLIIPLLICLYFYRKNKVSKFKKRND